MATRRRFAFGSLVLALTGASAARAGTPDLRQALSPGGAAPADPDPIRVRWGHRAVLRGRLLHVDLTVENLGEEPIELVVARGDLPGAHLQAEIRIDGDGLGLSPYWEGDRRKVFASRIGPIPQWAPLAAKAKLELGPYRFVWPEGVPVLPVQLRAYLDSERGGLELATTVTPDAAKART